MALPKLRDDFSAYATNERPTKRASDYDIAWVSGLKLRKTDVTAAVCVTRRGRDPRESGLHLTVDAARELATQMRRAAAIACGAVAVTNRDDNVWAVLVDADALVLADRLAGVSGGQ